MGVLWKSVLWLCGDFNIHVFKAGLFCLFVLCLFYFFPFVLSCVAQ